MWLDPNDYVDIVKLKQTNTMLCDFMANMGSDVFYENHKTRVKSNQNVDWVAVVLFQRYGNPIDLSYVDPLFSIVQYQLQNIPSVIQAVINFVGPNSITPLHSDTQVYENVQGSIEFGKTYQLYSGISVPEFKNDDIGLCMNNETRIWKTGEFLAFDGNTPHHGWNRTNTQRVSLYVDVLAESFNNLHRE